MSHATDERFPRSRSGHQRLRPDWKLVFVRFSAAFTGQFTDSCGPWVGPSHTALFCWQRCSLLPTLRPLWVQPPTKAWLLEPWSAAQLVSAQRPDRAPQSSGPRGAPSGVTAEPPVLLAVNPVGPARSWLCESTPVRTVFQALAELCKWGMGVGCRRECSPPGEQLPTVMRVH